MMRHKHSHRGGLSKWLVILTCAGRPGGHVSRVSALLIDKYCCYQNLRRRQINLLPIQVGVECPNIRALAARSQVSNTDMDIIMIGLIID